MTRHSNPSTNVQSSNAEEALRVLEAAIEAGTINVCRSVAKNPYVIVHHQDGSSSRFALYEVQAREWLSYYLWQQNSVLLKRQEMDRILCALAGRSIGTTDGWRDDPELLRLIETEPVLAVAIEYMEQNSKSREETPMEELWKDWNKFARERGLYRLGQRKFPGGANVLSRRLTALKDVLNQLGISVKIWRSNGCKVVIERRKDDCVGEPSIEPSATNPNDGSGLHPTDDRKEFLAKLNARKASTSTLTDLGGHHGDKTVS